MKRRGKLFSHSIVVVGMVVVLVAAGIVGNDWVLEERYLRQLELGRRDWGDALKHLAATGRASAAPRILGLLKKECVQIFDGIMAFEGDPLTMVDQQHGLRYYLALLRLGPRAMPAMVKALGDEDIFFAFCVAITVTPHFRRPHFLGPVLVYAAPDYLELSHPQALMARRPKPRRAVLRGEGPAGTETGRMTHQGGRGGIEAIVALIGAPTSRLRGSAVRMVGPAAWVVALDAAGNFYEVRVTCHAGEEPAWSWDLTLDGVRLRGRRARFPDSWARPWP